MRIARSSFSVEALRESGKDPFADRSLLGKVLESYVVSQIVPDTQWGVHRADCYYWRESGRNPKEVDLALLCKKRTRWHLSQGFDIGFARGFRGALLFGVRSEIPSRLCCLLW